MPPEEQESLRRQLLGQRGSERLREWLEELRARVQLRSFVEASLPFAGGP